jgi:glycosyltransferase involved in cell wall biosynthesis
MVKCEKWKTQCSHCEQRRNHSWFLDQSRKLFDKKKELLTGLNMTIVTPSQWLADLVKQSFLKNYQVKVINNGIDIGIFRPTESDFRKKYGIEDKKIVLGVAFDWGIRKGLDVFVELADRLSDDYQIVLVGTNDKIDTQLPHNIISIHRTQNQQELAKIYSAADVFVNPTREENYPTVNMEALACGTPVLTFKTGGSPEIIDETCGSVVDCDDVAAMENEIIRICTDKIYSEIDCLKKARGFDQNERFEEYLKLYERVISAGN